MSINWYQERFSPQYLLPGLMVFLAVVIGSADFHIPDFRLVFPQIALMTIFYWGIFLPRLMPYWLGLLLGILQDALYGVPLGTQGFYNVVLLGILFGFRRYFVNATFPALWLIFALVAFVQILVTTMVMQYYYEYFHISGTAMMQWLLSLMVYPSMQWIYFWVHIKFLRMPG